MKTLDRYILRAFLTNYVIALAVMISLYILLDLFVNLDEFTKLDGGSAVGTLFKIIDYYGYNLLMYFAQLAGAILLLAACFTLGRFHRTNELTAVLASGTSLYRVATPMLLASLALNGLWLFDQEVLIPRFADKLARRHGDIEGRLSFAVWFLPDRDNALLSATKFHPNAREMRGLIVTRRDANDRMTEVIRADQAVWDEERGLWELRNGRRLRFVDPAPSDAARPPGPDAAGSEELGRVPVKEYVSDLTPKELALQQASMWTNFLSLPDLERLQERLAESARDQFIKIKHRRLTVVIMNMILLCVGMPFFLNRERVSVIAAGSRCLLACGICYSVTFVCQNMDLSILGVGPALTAWLPVLVFGPVAVLLMDGIKT